MLQWSVIGLANQVHANDHLGEKMSYINITELNESVTSGMSMSLPFWDATMGFADSKFKSVSIESNFCSKIINRTLLLTDEVANDRMK